jgi:hypothetical protein
LVGNAAGVEAGGAFEAVVDDSTELLAAVSAVSAMSAVRSIDPDADTVTAVMGIIGRLVEDVFGLFGDCDCHGAGPDEEEPMGVEVVRWIPERGAMSAVDCDPAMPEPEWAEAAGAAGAERAEGVAGAASGTGTEVEETRSEETAGMVWDA